MPGCIHLDLRRHGLIPDPFYGSNELDLAWIEREDWTYRAHFDVDKALLQHEVVELVADGLDTVAVVSLNGQPIGRSENMFAAARWAVEDFLKVGRNELLIEFASPLRYVESRTGPTTPASRAIPSAAPRSSARNSAPSAGTGARVSRPAACSATSAWRRGARRVGRRCASCRTTARMARSR